MLIKTTKKNMSRLKLNKTNLLTIKVIKIV